MVVTAAARADLQAILAHTARTFGTAQRGLYRDAIGVTLDVLRSGPAPTGSRPLDPNKPDELRRLAIRGVRSPHLLVFRQASPRTVVVLRVLHAAMDLTRHLPEEDG